MRTQLRWTVLFLVTVALLGISLVSDAPLHAQDKSLVWERFDVDIEVNADGTFDVAEEQEIRFTSGTFTFGFREIPIRNMDSIDNWEISDSSGNIYQRASSGGEPYTFTVNESGADYTIRWYFPPTANSSETYTLRYRVNGGLRFYDGGDQLWWKAIYGDRSFPVLDGRVRVVVPAAARIQEWAAYINGGDARDAATAQVMENGQAIIYELTRRLDAGEEFEVRVEFTPGIVDGTTPGWQAKADAVAAEREAELAYRQKWGPIAALGFGLLGLLLAGGGSAALYALWYRFGRDRPVELVADYLPEPPDTLSPGMAGTLLDETVDMEDVLATLIDLARRKAISITEEKEEGFLRSGSDFVYRRERTDVKLMPYEEKLLKSIFGSDDEIRLSDLKNKFHSKLDGIKKDMYKAVTDAGYFPRNPESVRSQYGCLGIFGIALGVGLGVILANVFGDLTGAAVLPGVGLAVVAIGLLILARHMPRKTAKGAEEAARWQAFRNYLEDIDKYSDLEVQKEIWDQWLPYAIAFGIDKQYIRKFEQVDAPAPGWYFPSPSMYGPYRRRYYGTPWAGPVILSGGGTSLPSGGGEGGGAGGGLSDMSRGMGTSLTAMSAGLGTMLNSASSTFTSRPASSSSGGGWSGGGGFSGGGSFGGGGGGGGGGGFG